MNFEGLVILCNDLLDIEINISDIIPTDNTKRFTIRNTNFTLYYINDNYMILCSTHKLYLVSVELQFYQMRTLTTSPGKIIDITISPDTHWICVLCKYTFTDCECITCKKNANILDQSYYEIMTYQINYGEFNINFRKNEITSPPNMLKPNIIINNAGMIE